MSSPARYQPVGAEIAPQQRQSPMQNLQGLIRQMAPEMQKALPKHMTGERMARIATTVLRQTPKLAECTPESFLGALLTSAQLGLEPGPLGEAYLVPYGRTVTFIPGYRGLIKLAYQSGQVRELYAQIVFANDEFKYTLGLHRDLQHTPAQGERGAPIAGYAVAHFKDGGYAFEVMTVPEIEAIRSRSRSGQNGPWKTDWEAMAKKTVVRQLAKWLPMSVELQRGLSLDETVRDGTDRGVPTVVDVPAGPALDLTPEIPAIDAVSDDVEGEQPAADVPPAEERTAKKATKAQRDRVQKRFDDEKLPDEMIPDALTSWAGREVTGLDDLTTDDITAIDAAFAQRDQAAAAADNEGK